MNYEDALTETISFRLSQEEIKYLDTLVPEFGRNRNDVIRRRLFYSSKSVNTFDKGSDSFSVDAQIVNARIDQINLQLEDIQKTFESLSVFLNKFFKESCIDNAFLVNVLLEIVAGSIIENRFSSIKQINEYIPELKKKVRSKFEPKKGEANNES